MKFINLQLNEKVSFLFHSSEDLMDFPVAFYLSIKEKSKQFFGEKKPTCATIL